MAVDVKPSDTNADVTIAALSGRLDMAASEDAHPKVMQALADSTAGLIVDMSELDFISSSGLRLLIAAQKGAQSSGKKLAFTHAKPAVYKIFKISSLDAMFSFFEDEAAAIGAFS